MPFSADESIDRLVVSSGLRDANLRYRARMCRVRSLDWSIYGQPQTADRPAGTPLACAEGHCLAYGRYDVPSSEPCDCHSNRRLPSPTRTQPVKNLVFQQRVGGATQAAARDRTGAGHRASPLADTYSPVSPLAGAKKSAAREPSTPWQKCRTAHNRNPKPCASAGLRSTKPTGTHPDFNSGASLATSFFNLRLTRQDIEPLSPLHNRRSPLPSERTMYPFESQAIDRDKPRQPGSPFLVNEQLLRHRDPVQSDLPREFLDTFYFQIR